MHYLYSLALKEVVSKCSRLQAGVVNGNHCCVDTSDSMKNIYFKRKKNLCLNFRIKLKDQTWLTNMKRNFMGVNSRFFLSVEPKEKIVQFRWHSARPIQCTILTAKHGGGSIMLWAKGASVQACFHNDIRSDGARWVAWTETVTENEKVEQLLQANMIRSDRNKWDYCSFNHSGHFPSISFTLKWESSTLWSDDTIKPSHTFHLTLKHFETVFVRFKDRKRFLSHCETLYKCLDRWAKEQWS